MRSTLRVKAEYVPLVCPRQTCSSPVPEHHRFTAGKNACTTLILRYSVICDKHNLSYLSS